MVFLLGECACMVYCLLASCVLVCSPCIDVMHARAYIHPYMWLYIGSKMKESCTMNEMIRLTLGSSIYFVNIDCCALGCCYKNTVVNLNG